MMRGSYCGCPKVKSKVRKRPEFDPHLRCSGPNPPQAACEMALGGSLGRSRSQLRLVYRGCRHSSNNQRIRLRTGKVSKCRNVGRHRTFGRKTAKNRICSPMFTGYWTSTDRPDIPDASATAIFPVPSTAMSHIPFVRGGPGGGGLHFSTPSIFTHGSSHTS